jgi:hypothetical protein
MVSVQFAQNRVQVNVGQIAVSVKFTVLRGTEDYFV